MLRFIQRRLILAIPVLIGVTILTFILTNLLPGDPARALAGHYATADQIEATRERLGLNKPIYEQYARYMIRLFQGDLGVSITSRAPVIHELTIYFPATLELTMFAMIITVIIGIPLGLFSSIYRSPWISSFVISLSFLGVGLPVFWAALIAQLIFFGKLEILPLDGRLSPGSPIPTSVTGMYTVDALLAGQYMIYMDAVWHLIMPGVILAIPAIASISRITHASMVEVMQKDYIRTARSKGLKSRSVVIGHALKNGLLPTITQLGLLVGWAMSGSILVENIFSWGGLGTYAWIGINRLDLPVILGITLLTTLVFVIINLIVDVSYGFLDPRINLQ